MMTETNEPIDEIADDAAVDNAATKLDQALVDKKAAVAKKRQQPPFPKPRGLHKGKKVGNAPRGTRKSMGKR